MAGQLAVSRAVPVASSAPGVLSAVVVVSALGYFVDIYDLILFSIVRVASLTDLGVPAGEQLGAGVLILNAQMVGMLLGGLAWGVLGDRRGRRSVLFGSILLYSGATLANAFVTDVVAYAALRFVAGVGLAGELGAAIALVSEVLGKEERGYAAALVAGVGILGAVAAFAVGALFDWRVAYGVGGVLGFALLFLRANLVESGMFRALAEERRDVRRGDLRLLVASGERFARYARCILVGLPVWFVVGVIVTFSPELARALGVAGAVSAPKAVLFTYVGLAVGDVESGVLSARLRSRRRALLVFLGLTGLLTVGMLLARGYSASAFYMLCVLLGFAAGFWAVFMTAAAEQFGTNLRATVATTVPNFVRGSTVLMTLAFSGLAPALGLVASALAVGVACIGLAVAGVLLSDETYGRDLDYVEA